MSSNITNEDKRIAADILIAAINNDLFTLSNIVLEDQDDVSEQANEIGRAFVIILESVSSPPAS